MAESSKDLLELETRNSSTSTVESLLLVCKKDGSSKGQISESKCHGGESKTSSVPTSQVLGKVKDFLGIMSESNKMLEKSAKDNAKDFNIEMLNGNETEYIEMDLMLGVADLHTPEAIAAAEAAIASGQQVISLEDSDDDSSGSESDEENDDIVVDGKEEDKSSSKKRKKPSDNKKQKKIVELS
ncbi:uncharacterized protein LOC124939912 [Impatiens glandulifera]|uniref:uncharacterized protein LOC124939912 n=1 Tax=Impatiens glandulifera TaxID=253017 RepID=UPI001FB0B564|nr:uncharacterized protein LOC124939912 [Impatiens glandulifera]